MKHWHPLSTGDIGKYCYMSTSTVRKWIKSGKLKAYTTPDGQYRVELVDFRDFLERYEMPIREDYFDHHEVPAANRGPEGKALPDLPGQKKAQRRTV